MPLADPNKVIPEKEKVSSSQPIETEKSAEEKVKSVEVKTEKRKTNV